MASQESPDERAAWDDAESQAENTYYSDSSLDEAHDDEGYVDEHEWEHLYALRPTWLQRLWWWSRRVVYLISFFIPWLMLILILFVAGVLGIGSSSDHDPVPESVPAVNPAWPPEVDFIPNTAPAMIRNDLTLAGMKQGYLFHGTAGQMWRITVDPEYDSTLDPQITLYAPSGRMLAQQGGEIAITLPENGAYRLLVESAQGGLTTGPYLLSLFEG